MLGGRPPLARVGERWTYRIQLQGVELAEYLVEVADAPEGGGAVEVRSLARSTGVGAWLKKVETRFTSTIDGATGWPRRFRSEERAGRRDPTIERSDARLAELSDGAVPVRVRRGDDEHERVESQRVRGPVWDLNAVMIALRQLEAPAGAQLELESFRSRFVWRTRLTVAGREALRTELGRVPALRIDGWGHGLRRDGELNDEPERRFSLWISDDADRVPLLLVGATDYGDLRMEITSYSPPGEAPGGE